jgi:hypothetical protein
VTKKFRKQARKRYRTPTKPQRSQSWALAFHLDDWELSHLSSEARDGLEYSRQIALVARERRRSALEDDVLPEALTIERLAREQQTSPVLISKAIKQARIEIFGRDLKNAAIYYRLRMRRERGVRLCAEPRCGQSLPALANGRRRYCDVHGTAAARVRRHRASAPDEKG